MINNRDKIEELLMEKGYEGAKYLINYDYATAIVGVTSNNEVVYDYNKMIEYLVKYENMTESDAQEWIDYNTVRALSYMGEGSPIIMYPIEF